MRVCQIGGCEKPSRGGAWCEMHYYRNRRYGDPLHERSVTVSCSVEGCARPHSALGLCHTHEARFRRWGDPMIVRKSNWTGPPTTYGGAHQALRRERGPAADHACSACGGEAAQWAYQHNDPDQVESDDGPYSHDPDCYAAMCVPCHKAFDLMILALSPALRVRCNTSSL